MSDLGRLERVELRNIWKTEAQDFTPWLAREENLALLGKTLGIAGLHRGWMICIGCSMTGFASLILKSRG